MRFSIPRLLRVGALAMLVVALSVVTAGCKKGTNASTHNSKSSFPSEKISGKVTYKDEPVILGFVVFFQPNSGYGWGSINSNGTYEVTNAPIGQVGYVVITDPNMLDVSMKALDDMFPSEDQSTARPSQRPGPGGQSNPFGPSNPPPGMPSRPHALSSSTPGRSSENPSDHGGGGRPGSDPLGSNAHPPSSIGGRPVPSDAPSGAHLPSGAPGESSGWDPKMGAGGMGRDGRPGDTVKKRIAEGMKKMYEMLPEEKRATLKAVNDRYGDVRRPHSTTIEPGQGTFDINIED